MRRKEHLRGLLLPCALLLASAAASCGLRAEEPRLVIADQDASGPGGSDMASLLVLLQSPKARLLGITVVTGDGWRDEEVAHALRLLETVGRTDIGVYPGAAFPLVRSEEQTRRESALYGKASWLGAWREDNRHRWDEVPPLPEGAPITKQSSEDAVHFMVRCVHEHPHQVTIYAAGPLTNVALAVRLDPHFAELAQELVVMGGSLAPRTDDREWLNQPRHEFNFWFDPEAASIALHAAWPKISVTTVDASVQTRLAGVISAVRQSQSPAAQYLVRYAGATGATDYAWDELAAATWLDPEITRRARDVYMDVELSRGASYGNTLTWDDTDRPELPLRKVRAQVDVDAARLERDLVALFTAPTPGAKEPRPLPASPHPAAQ